MNNLSKSILLSLIISIFTISCGSIGTGGSTVSVKAIDVETTFEPKTSIAFIDKGSDRRKLHLVLANFNFEPKDKGDIFRPSVGGSVDNVLVTLEIIAAEKADSNESFKPGETSLLKGDDSKQRFYKINIVQNVKNSSRVVKIGSYKDAKIELVSITGNEISGTFEVKFTAIGKDGIKDEDAVVNGKFNSKIWDPKE